MVGLKMNALPFSTTERSSNQILSIFASSPILAKIEEMRVRNYHVDATFKVVPYGQFRQLLVLHINFDEHAFPLVYVLMTRKTQESYCSVFQYIEDNVCHLRPDSFMSDYETGMRNALRIVYPNIPVDGCWFHYCQAIKKKCSRIPNFFSLLQAEPTAKKLYHKFLALPLVRLDLIPDACAHLITEGAVFGEPYAKFIQYFEQQWIRTETGASFCVFQRVSRTNNLVESHNSHLHAKIQSKGNFFKFIETLLDECSIKSRALSQLIEGGQRVYARQRKVTEKRNLKIRKLQSKLNSNELTFQAFLNQVTFFDNRMMVDMAEMPVDDPILSDDDGDIPEDFEVQVSVLFPAPAIIEPTVDDLQRQLQNASRAHERDINCVICTVERKSRLLLPCGHIPICSDCNDELVMQGDMKCPLCRSTITATIQAFL